MTEESHDKPEASPAKNHSALIASIGGGLGGAGALGAGAPWWAFMACLVAGLLCAMVNSVFPQESADRLAWWKALWNRPHRENLRTDRDGARRSHSTNTNQLG